MSYGIEFSNANGDVQIDSNTTGKGFIITASGTNATSTGTLDLQKELVFARPSATTANYYFYAKQISNALYFYNDQGNLIDADYFVVSPSDDLTASSGGYGVQIYNSDGDLTFDSGTVSNTGGVNITDYLAAFSASGDYDLLDTDETKYALMNSSFFSEDSLELGYYYANNTPPSGLGPTSTGIYYYGLLYIDLGIGVQIENVSNLGAILLAEKGSV